MICSSSSPPIRRRPGEGRGPRGFTLVELLVVILILAVLIALLLPALNGALKTARNAAVGAEINQLAQALASFKAKYGDYPPSRIYLSEDGNFCRRRRPRPRSHPATSPTRSSAQRSIAALRKFFPEGVLAHLGRGRLRTGSSSWYDFNGNGSQWQRRHAHTSSRATSAWSSSWAGFRCPILSPSQRRPRRRLHDGVRQGSHESVQQQHFQRPELPFNGTANPMYSGNRQAPLFEFANNRLVLDPSDTSGIPGT